MSEKAEQIEILKVRFDNVTNQEALEKALDLIKTGKQTYITTPNPEILLEAENNHGFREVLNNSALNIPDGIGILWASKYLDATKNSKSKPIKFAKWLGSILAVPFHPSYIRTVLKERVTGIDLMENLCKESVKYGYRIFLLGAKEGTAELTKEILEKRYNGLNIVGTFSGSPKIEDEPPILEKINTATPDILFVAYGAPNQELWIARNLAKMPPVKLAIGIGGAFNFIAGIRKRAPKWMQNLGIEWMYRLIQEPSRIKRIYNATIKFSTKVLKKNL